MISFSKNYVYLLLLLFVTSCCKEEKSLCGQEIKVRFGISNPEDFKYYNNQMTFGDAKFYAGNIFQDSTRKYYTLYLQLENICKSDIPVIEFNVILQHPDTSIRVRAFIQEANSQTEIPITTDDGINYHLSWKYYYWRNYKDSASVTLEAFTGLYFPRKATAEADSIYFFSNLLSMSCSITAHKPK